MKPALIWLWLAGDAATFIYLLFFNGAKFNWWNWVIIGPIDFFLAGIWPIYWMILRPIVGN